MGGLAGPLRIMRVANLEPAAGFTVSDVRSELVFVHEGIQREDVKAVPLE